MLPIDVTRVYFVHDIDNDTVRGDHGHYRTNQILIAVEGTIVISCYDGISRREFILDSSEKALYVPAGIWTTNSHNKGSVMCVLADRPYNVRDYIEDRGVFKRWKRRQPFFGVFDSFGDLDVKDMLENEEFLDYQLSELAEIGEPDPILADVVSDSVTVVDFGGSLGHSYAKFAHIKDLEYHVIETKSIVNAANKLFAGHDSLFFHDSIPDPSGPIQLVDIVYSRTSLQYVEDWRGVLERLAKFEPEYMILSDMQAGKIPTFVGIQNWYGHFIPNWFFNVDELIDAIPGYDLDKFSTGMAVNMSNYKKENRLSHACNLTLKRHRS